MGIKFVDGPYGGKEADYASVVMHATPVPLEGDLGQRFFVLMPPLENWERILNGESAEETPLYPYERVLTQDGPKFVWSPGKTLHNARIESLLKVSSRASTALSTLSTELRKSIIREISELQIKSPDDWQTKQVNKNSSEIPVYLVPLSNSLVAFVRVLKTGEIELYDIVREETLRSFQKQHASASRPE